MYRTNYSNIKMAIFFYKKPDTINRYVIKAYHVNSTWYFSSELFRDNLYVIHQVIFLLQDSNPVFLYSIPMTSTEEVYHALTMTSYIIIVISLKNNVNMWKWINPFSITTQNIRSTYLLFWWEHFIAYIQSFGEGLFESFDIRIVQNKWRVVEFFEVFAMGFRELCEMCNQIYLTWEFDVTS